MTAHIQEEGESVPLLLQRASHYRVLGQPALAIADLLRVLQLQPRQQGALVELARLHLALGDFEAARVWIDQAINAAGLTRAEPHLFAVRAEILVAQGHLAQAVREYDRAIAGDGRQLDWYLDRSSVHERLDMPQERIAGLWQGHESTRSTVLFNEWIDALIDGGRSEEALREIEPRLTQARLQSSWLLRRARALHVPGGVQNKAQAEQDLHAAIAEINIRLRPSRPDVGLLLDRALAHFLLGDRSAAQADFALAEKQGAPKQQLERFSRMIARQQG